MSPDNTECDCGRPKFGGAECCSHCREMDGTTYAESCVIGLLRVHSWCTLSELGAMIGIGPDAVYKPMSRLFKAGRVRRQWRERDPVEITARNRYGGRQRMTSGAKRAWEYALTLPKRRAA